MDNATHVLSRRHLAAVRHLAGLMQLHREAGAKI